MKHFFSFTVSQKKRVPLDFFQLYHLRMDAHRRVHVCVYYFRVCQERLIYCMRTFANPLNNSSRLTTASYLLEDNAISCNILVENFT